MNGIDLKISIMDLFKSDEDYYRPHFYGLCPRAQTLVIAVGTPLDVLDSLSRVSSWSTSSTGPVDRVGEFHLPI